MSGARVLPWAGVADGCGCSVAGERHVAMHRYAGSSSDIDSRLETCFAVDDAGRSSDDIGDGR
jgi:hypothetical protein